MISIPNRWKQIVPICIAAALLLAGCSTAGETDADVEEFLGVQLESSAGEMTAQDALKKAEDFVNAAAPDQFLLALDGEETTQIGSQQLYLIRLTTKDGGASYDPSLAVDAASGILYSSYADGTLKPAAEDECWKNITEIAGLTPEEQQNLAEASSYASEVLAEGTADFVLTLKTGQYVYADGNAVYIGYGGDVHQTLFHDGNETVVIDETTLLAKDMNFDGYEDILLATTSGTVNSYYYLWLCDPAEGNFVAYPGFEELSAPTPNPETERVSTYERGNAADYTQGVWKWDDSGMLTQVSSYQVATDEDGNVTISSTDEAGEATSFTVTSEEYTTVNELMSGALVDFCISRYGGSEQRSFTFEGMADVTDISCYSVVMTEGGTPAVRMYIDESKTYMVMLDEDCDGTPEETVNINE